MTDPDTPASHSSDNGDSDDAPPLLKTMIRDALDTCNDANLLDLIYKMLIYEY